MTPLGITIVSIGICSGLLTLWMLWMERASNRKISLGTAVVPDVDALIRVAEKLIEGYPRKLPLPQIIPKQDGNLLLEWWIEGDPSLDIDLTKSQASFHAFGLHGEDIQRDFNLDADGWQALFAFLSENIKA